MTPTRCLLPVWTAILTAAALAQTQDIRYPDDANIVNVKDHGVKGDGATDDTAGLQAVFKKYSGVVSWAHDRTTLYLPNGTYLVSEPLLFHALVSVQGQSEQGVIIRLKDQSAAFQNPAKPAPVIRMHPDAPKTNLNMEFGTYLLNVTIETGQKNPGASGVALCAHNTGGLQHVTIRCGPDGGVYGLDMRQPVQGPALCRDVRIEGPFDYGIRMDPSVTASTFENIEIVKPRKGGVAAVKHPAAFRLLRYEGEAPAIVELESDCEGAHLVIVDSSFSGGKPDGVAVNLAANKGDTEDGDTIVLLRNVDVSGFGIGVKNTDGSTVEPAKLKGEWHTGKAMTAFPSSEAKTLNLPVKEVPPMPWEDPATWANVRSFGAIRLTAQNRRPTDKQDGRFMDELGEVYEITEALQKAIDSGATTVYLPKGLYLLRKPIVLRGKLRVLQACRSVIFCDPTSTELTSMPDPGAKELKRGGAMLVLEGEGAETVWVDQLSASFRHTCPRTLVLTRGGGSYIDGPGAGDLFMDDICMAPMEFIVPHNVWIRQCDTEADFLKINNKAATVWILGIKTEGVGPNVFTGPGASTEILGGLFYPGMRATKGWSIEVVDGRFSASIARFWDRKEFYKETRKGETKTVETKGGHRMVPLLTGR